MSGKNTNPRKIRWLSGLVKAAEPIDDPRNSSANPVPGIILINRGHYEPEA